MQRQDGVASDVRIGLIGVGEMPMRASQIEVMLEGREIGAALLDEAVEALRAGLEPNSDLNASADYRRHLAGVLARRAISDAWARTAKGAVA
jgi:carbon-monoxide dehydrogenase medium subunit